MSDRIRICIGTEPKTKVPCDVLKHSILKTAKSPEKIEFHELLGDSWISAKDRPFQIGTGFSLFRWYIPEKFNFEGYAIYLDADQLVLKDIEELWKSDVLYPNKNTSVWMTHQRGHFESSVMFIDCAKAKEQWPSRAEIEKKLAVDHTRQYYHSLMWAQELKIAPQRIPDYWNQLNEIRKDTRLIHYTIEATQPWYDPKHAFSGHWKRALREAIQDGAVDVNEIIAACRQWKPRDKTAGTRHQGMNPVWGEYARSILATSPPSPTPSQTVDTPIQSNPNQSDEIVLEL